MKTLILYVIGLLILSSVYNNNRYILFKQKTKGFDRTSNQVWRSNPYVKYFVCVLSVALQAIIKINLPGTLNKRFCKKIQAAQNKCIRFCLSQTDRM